MKKLNDYLKERLQKLDSEIDIIRKDELRYIKENKIELAKQAKSLYQYKIGYKSALKDLYIITECNN